VVRAGQTTGRTPSILWFALAGVGLGAVLIERARLGVPEWVPGAGAVVITTAFAFGLVARTGGRALAGGAVALVLIAGAQLSGSPMLVAGAAVCTAALAGVLAVMATSAAVRFSGVVRECAIAVAVAVVGAFAVAAYDPQVSLVRATYVALGLALFGALGLVFRLGAGVHGLGRRGSIMVATGVLLLLVGFVYTEAFTRWGPPTLLSGIEQARTEIGAMLGAVPRPLLVFIGIPSLVWGVSTRARSRQGWWVCTFAAPAFAMVAVSLLDPERSLPEFALSTGYSAALGLLLGYLVIRADTYLEGVRGRDARRREQAGPHRPEPSRIRPLQ